MELPDVIGFPLDEALAELREHGFTVAAVVTTKPVRGGEPIGIARVLRLSFAEGQLQVIAAYQDYGKEV